MRRFAKYLAIMLLPLCVLLSHVAIPFVVVNFGQEIKLATVPVDPREIFRGDYVNLSFEIDNVSSSLLPEELTGFTGQEMNLYLVLSEDKDGISRPFKISVERPEEGAYVFVPKALAYSGEVYLDHGGYLTRYYVRENTGRELEEAAQNGEITAIAKVLYGYIVLTGLK